MSTYVVQSLDHLIVALLDVAGIKMEIQNKTSLLIITPKLRLIDQKSLIPMLDHGMDLSMVPGEFLRVILTQLET